jgi:hypothetical protein
MRVATNWLTISASIGLLCCFGAAQQSAYDPPLPLASIIDGLEKAQAETVGRPAFVYGAPGRRRRSENSLVVAKRDPRQNHICGVQRDLVAKPSGSGSGCTSFWSSRLDFAHPGLPERS